MAEPIPELRIVQTLKELARTYSELKGLTGLSDRWLTIKLKILEGMDILQKAGNKYRLSIYGLDESSPHLKCP